MRWLPLASYLLRQVVVAGYAVLASCVAGYMAVARKNAKIAGHVELQLISLLLAIERRGMQRACQCAFVYLQHVHPRVHVP